MPVLVSVIVAASALLCLLKPVWGFLAYLAVVIIRPNEMLPEMLLPAAPIMIVAAAVGFLVNHWRTLPPIRGGERPRSVLYMGLMLGLLLVHLLLLHRELLVDWVVNDLAQFVLMTLYMYGYFSTPERQPVSLGGIMTSAGLVALLPLPIHFLFKGPMRLMEAGKRLDFPSYGRLWDLYHFEGLRLMGRQGTLWANPNSLGIAANWALPGALYNLRKAGWATAKVLYLALFTGLVTTLILTGSRAGLLQLGVILWMVFVGGRRKKLGVLLLVVTMVGLTFVLPMLEPERTDAHASSTERAWVLSTGVAMFKRSPIFGVGFGNYQANSPHRLLAHNAYMQSLAETGLLGFGLFMAFSLYLRRETAAAVRFFESSADPNTALAARCIGAMQLGFAVYAFFSNVFMTFMFAIPMTAAIGLFLAMQRERSLQEQPTAGAAADAREIPDAAPRLPAAARPAPTPDAEPEARWVFDPALPEAGPRLLEAGPRPLEAGAQDRPDDGRDPQRPPRS